MVTEVIKKHEGIMGHNHYARNTRLSGEKIVNKTFTHKINRCLFCTCEILVVARQKKPSKICKDCKEKYTTEEIRAKYKESHIHRREQQKAKHSLNVPSEQRFIFNSPFRSGAGEQRVPAPSNDKSLQDKL